MTAADIEALDRLVERFGPRIAGIAGHIDLENHAGVTETAKASLDLCRGIGSAAPGINHDAGNVRFYSGIDPVADLAAVYRQIGFHGPFRLEIEFKGPESTDSSPEIIDRGVARSFRFMQDLRL